MSNVEIIDELFEPVAACLTPDVARKLAALRASQVVQARLDDFAEKSTEGRLTPAERSDYESYLRGMNFIAVLQAQARRVLAQQT
ncbi:MAG TPA: hypothetical protein VND64_06975 [Pirellulales bacterium]|nr:hypothetical protein [Pirellulales bacterium]